MSSPPRTRQFFRPLLEDIRRIVRDCKQRCAASVSLISRMCTGCTEHTSSEWTIESPVQRTVRVDYWKLSGRAVFSVDGINVFERSPFEIQETHEIEIDDVRYTLVIRSERGFTCRFLRSGTPEAESEIMASRKQLRRFALLLVAFCLCFLIAALTLLSRLALTEFDANVTGKVYVVLVGVFFCALGFRCVAVSYMPPGLFRFVRSGNDVFEDAPKQFIAYSILLPLALTFSVVSGVFLFIRAYDTTPAETFLSVAGAVVSFSLAILFGWMWMRLSVWWRRVPDNDVPVNTTEGTRPRSGADCRRLLEDIHRTAAPR